MMPMTPSAPHGWRDISPSMRPRAPADTQRRGMVNQSGFAETLSGAQDAAAAGPETAPVPSPAVAQVPQPSPDTATGTAADASAASMPTTQNATAWTGPQAAAYAQQYGAPYPAAAQAMITPPPGADALLVSDSPQTATAATGGFMTNTPDAVSAYANAAADPMLSSPQGFSAVA